ncbi:Esterase FE4 [Frankliniella fusca]|uniref:Carboxylic ester hydrolase n=1 Tax=Frankliniella fusca TaxID=407009 RepID=A0AAE1LMR1_9NEOP|nr:Esterase FE4 [Frankliniella fusca]
MTSFWHHFYKGGPIGRRSRAPSPCPSLSRPKRVNAAHLQLRKSAVRFLLLQTVSRAQPLPVMVWIHGGAFLTGSGWMYGPEFILDKDVILVSFNYRLGVLGFLSTGDDVIPGNFGMKDQVQLLRWVRDNIVAFGGDPGQVTIFGESAGGASVHALTLSPLAKVCHLADDKRMTN